LWDEDRNSLVRVIKVDHETGEVLNVTDLPKAEDERSGGCSFCNEIYDFTWAFLVQMQAVEDWLRIYEASSDFFWLNVEPLESFLFPGEEMDIHIGISTDGLIAEETYTSHLLINHNTPVEGILWIDITLNVIEREHSAPSDADVPFAHGLTSIYPNPFNAVGSVNFALDRASTVRLTVHDLVGRQVAVLTDGYMSSGQYSVVIDGSSWSSGTYLVSLSDGSRVSLMKVVLLK